MFEKYSFYLPSWDLPPFPLEKGGKSPPYLRGIEGDLKSFEYHL
jgi:hypothetical protein